jgi:hypothetical protein
VLRNKQPIKFVGGGEGNGGTAVTMAIFEALNDSSLQASVVSQVNEELTLLRSDTEDLRRTTDSQGIECGLKCTVSTDNGVSVRNHLLLVSCKLHMGGASMTAVASEVEHVANKGGQQMEYIILGIAPYWNEIEAAQRPDAKVVVLLQTGALETMFATWGAFPVAQLISEYFQRSKDLASV